jgi:hypothetical protein
VDTALVAVHRLIVVQAAGTEAPAHPFDMLPDRLAAQNYEADDCKSRPHLKATIF